MEVGPIRQHRLSDDIVEQLETLILEGTLQPGQRLPAERALAEQFGVSRPSVREAVQKLAARGLVISRQGGGNYVSDSLGSSFSDPLMNLLESRPEARRDLLEFRHTLEADCAYYAARRATDLDRQQLQLAFDELQACYAREPKASREEEGAADARFHLAIAQASHNLVLLHTIRGLFDLLKRSVVTNIGGMYALRSDARDTLIAQHQALFDAIMAGRAEDARRIAGEHIRFVQSVLDEREGEIRRLARAQRRERPKT
ncbi:MAG: GntR family transcriptional regulator [Marinobacter sp.]|uniref:GntR family transcriptional regulator n=1 Tax=Marinobacter sp. TaxID=50741 RepID=UPI003C549056